MRWVRNPPSRKRWAKNNRNKSKIVHDLKKESLKETEYNFTNLEAKLYSNSFYGNA